MKITFQKSLVTTAILGWLIACLTPVRAAEPRGTATKDSQSLVIEMRIKRWQKDLQMSADQLDKVKALLVDEGKQVAKLDEDKALTLKDRVAKVDEIHKSTYDKIKPVLTAQQVPVFEKLVTRTTKAKKPAPAAKP